MKSINYACAVKNDTPLVCTVGSKCRWDLSPEEKEWWWSHKHKKTMRYSDRYSYYIDVRWSVTSLLPTILLNLLVQWAGSSPSRLFTCRYGLLWEILHADRICCSSEMFCWVKCELYLWLGEYIIHCIHNLLLTGDCLWTNELFIGITALKVVSWWKWGAEVSPVSCLKIVSE